MGYVHSNTMQFDAILGAVLAVGLNLLFIALLIARLVGRSRLEYWLGLIAIAAIFPLSYLAWVAFSIERPQLYELQISLMMLFLIVELVVDYILTYDFRRVRPMAVAYVMLFCGATGGMIGVAAWAGPVWMYAAIVTFLILVGVAFYQRAKTEM